MNSDKIKNMEKEERRRYFRIDDVVQIEVEKINSVDLDSAIEDFDNKRNTYCMMNSISHEKEQYLPERKSIEKSYPDIAKYLQYLENRIEILASMLMSEKKDEILPTQKLNISAQGIRFYSDIDFDSEDLVEIKLILPDSHERLLVIGTVVWCKNNTSDQYSQYKNIAAIDFTYIHEADREILIKHIHSKQVEILQNDNVDMARHENA